MGGFCLKENYTHTHIIQQLAVTKTHSVSAAIQNHSSGTSDFMLVILLRRWRSSLVATV